ncbi:MAG: hypothetical protein ACD_79C01243G0003 [uncultured bacterium]|nr:MAG: hypothetical protein ACD_79C01243G0003 [uncultured bacterium]
MPEYSYEGMDNKGKEITGVIVAESKVSAINKIRDMGYFPTSVVENKSSAKKTHQYKTAPKMGFFSNRNVKEKELVTFMRQFATLVDAGLPILRCLRVLEKQNKGKALNFILKDVGDSIESGVSLSNALQNYQHIFSPLFVNMVNAGEVGGVLDQILIQMAEYYEKSSKLKKKVKSSMIYPLFVLIIAMIVVSALIIFIIPKFAKMFTEMDLQLPAMTKFLIDFSDFFKNNWYIPIILIIIFGILGKVFLANSKTRYAIHSILFRLPVIGELVSKVAIARFTRTFGTLINSGVQILEALRITQTTVGNAVVESAINMVHDNLKEGDSIVNPLTHANIFPPMVISMVSVGEETGRISEMLIKIAESYEDDIDAAVAGITSLIEPVLIITLAGIVGFIVISMFLPLISLISTMTQ